jgi:predicted transcriptional regulator of viral defense system
VPALGGGVRHVVEILDAYLLDADIHSLIDSLSWLGNGAAFTRLGYLLEHLGVEDPSAVAAVSDRVTSGFSLLDPSQPAAGSRSTRWGLLVNADLAA